MNQKHIKAQVITRLKEIVGIKNQTPILVSDDIGFTDLEIAGYLIKSGPYVCSE